MRLADRLKEIRRQGWVDRGVQSPESTADHSWAVALFAWMLALERADLDEGRVLLLALVHDLPEALAGDATPFDRYRDEQGAIPPDHFRSAPDYKAGETRRKHEQEREALRDMTNSLPGELTDRIAGAWEEYSAGATPEARFVRQLDKLETLLQAELFRETQPEIIIDSFRSGTLRDIDDPALYRIAEAVIARAHAAGSESDDDDDERSDGR